MFSRGIDLRVSQMGKVIVEANSEDLYFIHKFGGYKDAPDWVVMAESYCKPNLPIEDGQIAVPDMRLEYRATRIPFRRSELRNHYRTCALVGIASGVFSFAVMSVIQLFGV